VSFRGLPLVTGVATPYPESDGVTVSLPVDVVQFGGLKIATGVFADGASHLVDLQGFVRLHAFRCFNQFETAFLSNPGGILGTGAIYAVQASVYAPSDLAPGQLCGEALQVQCPGSTGDWRYSLFYDELVGPIIK
jgi:hypothetical protein